MILLKISKFYFFKIYTVIQLVDKKKYIKNIFRNL